MSVPQSAEGPIRRRVVVRGLVQGVWFRQSTRTEADALGVSGSVRNMPDGSVEAVFEGPASLVEAMIEWCRSGPPRAVVEHVEVSAEQPEGLEGFRVTG